MSITHNRVRISHEIAPRSRQLTASATGTTSAPDTPEHAGRAVESLATSARS